MAGGESAMAAHIIKVQPGIGFGTMRQDTSILNHSINSLSVAQDFERRFRVEVVASSFCFATWALYLSRWTASLRGSIRA